MPNNSRRCGCTENTCCAQCVTPVHTTVAEFLETVAEGSRPGNPETDPVLDPALRPLRGQARRLDLLSGVLHRHPHPH